MKCPKCDSDMEKVTYASIEVDRCLGCRGLWLDALEADKLRNVKGSESIDSGDPKVGRQYNKVEDVDCPHCDVQMLRMVDPGQAHIWYESCPRCYGVFFDAGEFADYRDEGVLDWFKGLFHKERK
ncbi:MAG: zf-TFIIB domain-containing protein [Phycisphaerae bacterium]